MPALDVPSRREHFHRFMKGVHGHLHELRSVEDPLPRVAAGIAADARVLCLDELFVSDIADAMILSGLFESLVAQGVTLVFTSNAPPSGLYRDGLQRSRFLPAIALLERCCEIVNVDAGTDYRLRQLEKAPLYLDSRVERRRRSHAGALRGDRGHAWQTPASPSKSRDGRSRRGASARTSRGSTSPQSAQGRGARPTTSRSHATSTPCWSRTCRFST